MAKGGGRQEKPSGPKVSISPAERAELRAARAKLGWTQPAMADRMGVSQGTISNLESGRSDQVFKSVYVAARRLLKLGDAKDAGEDSDRLNRVTSKFLELSNEHQAAVENLIDSLIAARK